MINVLMHPETQRGFLIVRVIFDTPFLHVLILSTIRLIIVLSQALFTVLISEVAEHPG